MVTMGATDITGADGTDRIMALTMEDIATMVGMAVTTGDMDTGIDTGGSSGYSPASPS